MRWVAALTAAFVAAGATCARADDLNFGRLGEPLRLNIAITPSQAGSWTGILAHEKNTGNDSCRAGRAWSSTSPCAAR